METMERTVIAAIDAGKVAAAQAASTFLTAHGEGPCGFAWCTAQVKGSTKMGRVLLKNGFDKAYGGGLSIWNPSDNMTQSIDAKEHGAYAFALVMREKLGIDISMGSRMD